MTDLARTAAALVALAGMAPGGPLGAGPAWAQPPVPSFDCSHVSARATRLICASPALGALDRKLSEDFAAISHQGGVDAGRLRQDEDHWLNTVRNRCDDAPCLASAYRARDAVLLDRSLRAASPAAFDDTRPYPAPPSALAAARAMIGKPCGGAPATAFPGFSKLRGFLPIVLNGGYVAPFAAQGGRFAFLLSYPDGDFKRCTVADVVTLPAPKPSEAFLQCSLKSGDSHGFGMREDGGRRTQYWTIDAGAGRLTREPIDVLGAATLICRQPETGE